MPTAQSKITFATLRDILKHHEHELVVQADDATSYLLCSRDVVDRAGRPLFCAGVRIGKAYVSYHLMAIYARPDLVQALSPSLRQRLHGKSCFNFKQIEPAHVLELARLTRVSLQGFARAAAAWMQQPLTGVRRATPRPRRARAPHDRR
ncbi:MAG: hypothetical protein U1E76_18000 [Planctomycetota bacterium]